MWCICREFVVLVLVVFSRRAGFLATYLLFCSAWVALLRVGGIVGGVGSWDFCRCWNWAFVYVLMYI